MGTAGRWLWALGALCSLATLAGCAGKDAAPREQTASGFQLSPASPTLAIPAGRSGALALSIARTGGLATPVTLSATGLPTGGTASFTPNPAPDHASQLFLTVPASTAPGSYPIQVQGSAGALLASTALTVLVTEAPGFRCTLATPTASLVAGGQATVPVTLQRTGGWTDGVTFTLEGLPPGLTAVCDPNPATGTASTLTLAASPACTPGTYPLTLRGTSGALQHAVSLTATVTPAPDFSLAPGRQDVSLAQDASLDTPVDLTRIAGFQAPVTLAVEGLPPGLSASLSPNPVAGPGSTLTLSASTACTPGTYALTLRGTSGALQRTAPLNVLVTAAARAPFSVSTGASTWIMSPSKGSLGMRLEITRRDGFSEAITFSLLGLPSGMTALFDPNPTSDPATFLTLTSPGGLAEGTHTLTLKATAGPATFAIAFTLRITTEQALTLSFDPADLVLPPGPTRIVNVSVKRRSDVPASTPVDLHLAAPLPPGITVSGLPQQISGHAGSFTATADASSVPGAYDIPVRALAGSTVAIRMLRISVPGFSLGCRQNAAFLPLGTPQESTVTLDLTRFGGDTTPVTLGLAGLPSGVTCPEVPVTSSGTSVQVRFKGDGTTPEGVHALQVTASGGGQSLTLPLSLVVSGKSPGAFHPVGPTWEARTHGSAVRLADGRVLLTGGWGPQNLLSSSELFDPAAGGGVGAFTPGPRMLTARARHTSTLLQDGRVLILGGYVDANWTPAAYAELFDPSASGGKGAFTRIQSAPIVPRSWHAASLLPDGRVLILGGLGAGTRTRTVESFDPAGQGSFSSLGSLAYGRINFAHASLPDGSVVVFGGDQGTPLDSVERFTPGTGQTRQLAPLKIGRFLHSAVPLQDGSVLVLGGADESYTGPKAFVEHYRPDGESGSGSSTLLTAMTKARASFTVTALADGTLLAVGGSSTPSSPTATAERFNPTAMSGSWTATGPLARPRESHLAILLQDGRVLILGGGTTSAEVFQP